MKRVLLFIGIFFVLTILLLTGYGIYWKKSRSKEIVAFTESPNLEVGRMKVSILPEYDEPKVLVIYEGRFKDSTLFPSKARFIIPKGAEISDACSRSPQGGHFCQLFDIKERDEFDEIAMRLPYDTFFLSFYYNPLKKHVPEGFNRRGYKRAFEYPILSNYPVEVMEVSIQEPLRSADFKVEPAPMRVSTEKDFRFFNYVLSLPEKKKVVKFNISYTKKDRRPSVNIKYSDYGFMDEKLAGVPAHYLLSAIPILKGLFILGVAIFVLQVFRLYRGKKV